VHQLAVAPVARIVNSKVRSAVVMACASSRDRLIDTNPE
jgi:hypothetical protein